MSRSALSHTLRGLEARLGLRLLSRTTRSVSPTAAGERLLEVVGHRIEEIEAELEALSEVREKPARTIRITAHEHSFNAVLLPALRKFLPQYPDINVEVSIDYGLTDIVAQRYDAGVRSGGQVAKDMIAVRIGPDLRMAIVGAPSYFANRSVPKKPQDLTGHNCINLRLPSVVGCMPGSWQKAVARCGSASKVSSPSTARCRCSTRPWRDWGWPAYRRTWFSLISTTASSGACSRTGALHIVDTTSTTRAAASRHRRSHCWWMCCATVAR